MKLLIITILVLLISAFLVVLFVRGVLSWIPNKGGALASLDDVLTTITEPVVAPVRKLLPPTGGLDLSFIVVFFALYIVRAILIRM